MPFISVYWREQRSLRHLTKFCVTHQRMWLLALKHLITSNLALGNFISHSNNILIEIFIWPSEQQCPYSTYNYYLNTLYIRIVYFTHQKASDLPGRHKICFRFTWLVDIKFVLIYYKAGAFNRFNSKHNKKYN